MVFLALTRNAAAVLKIDIKKAITHDLARLPAMEDWIVDTIWNVKVEKKPGIMFYNKATGFVIPLNPAEYSLLYSLETMKEQLFRLLVEYGLVDKISYFQDLFSVIHLCKNNDRSAVAYMTQSKNLINGFLNADNDQRVSHSYDLLKRINEDMRKINGEYQQTRMKEFIQKVNKIDEKTGLVIALPKDNDTESMH